MARRKSFCRISTDDNGDYFLLSDVKNDGRDGIDITLTSGLHAWIGYLSDDMLEDMSQGLKMKFTDYVKETVNALTGNYRGVFVFQYQVTDLNCGSVEFTWKRYVPTESIKILLGTTTLKPSSDVTSVQKLIFTHCIDRERTLADTITSLESVNSRLSTERETAFKKYEQCVKDKEELEQDLYSKFVAVLNSKKDKVRELQSRLECRSEEPTASTSTSQPKTDTTNIGKEQRPGNSGLLESRLQSDSDSSDRDKTPSPVRRTNKKSRLTKGDDSPLMMDTSPDEPISVKNIRRHRRMLGNKNVTPSKLTLPRITSPATKSKTDSIRLSSLRKSSSTSQKSNEQYDSDDLLGDL